MFLFVLSLIAAAPGEPRVGCPGFSYVDIEAKRADAYLDYFSERLAERGGVNVTTKTEIESLLGFERQKKLLGCDENSPSCMAELAGALGADALVLGSIARIGSGYVATLKWVDARTATVRSAWSRRVSNDERLLDFLSETAAEMHSRFIMKAPPPSRSRVAPWIPAAAGGTLLAAGAGLLGVGVLHERSLRAPDSSITSRSDAEGVAWRGRVFEVSGYVVGSLGLVGLASAAGFALLPPADKSVALGISGHSDGWALSVSGVLP